LSEDYIPFLRLLAGSRPSENYLSRAFQACFRRSPIFANAIIKLLWKTCALKGSTPDSSEWTCEYQPATPRGKKIRPDLCLRPPLSSGHKPIYLESKVGAVLGEKQLLNYINSGAEILVAVTKKWPEVSRVRLRELGINHLRWQDISRTLTTLSCHKGVDKFLCAEFFEYLEDSDMSYREAISISNMEKIATCFTNIGTPGLDGFVPAASFDYANSCLSLLKDARRIAQESSPALVNCRNWGPGYFNITYDDDSSLVQWHALGMVMYPHNGYWRSRLLCAIYFPTENLKDILWTINHEGNLFTSKREISEHVHKHTTNGKLDADKLAMSIVAAVKKWKPF